MTIGEKQTFGFIGVVNGVSRDGGYGFIAVDSIQRPDGEYLGMQIDEDVFIHTRSGKWGERVELRNGMEVSFLLAPNERHGGKLRALQVEAL